MLVSGQSTIFPKSSISNRLFCVSTICRGVITRPCEGRGFEETMSSSVDKRRKKLQGKSCILDLQRQMDKRLRSSATAKCGPSGPGIDYSGLGRSCTGLSRHSLVYFGLKVIKIENRYFLLLLQKLFESRLLN